MSAANKANDSEPVESTEETTEETALILSHESSEPAQTGGQLSTHLQTGLGYARAAIDTAEKRRRARRIAFSVVGLLIVLPILSWMRYQSTHVMSTNAIIRGHVTEIGTRLNGLVKHVEVDTGDRVVAGQVLVTLEDRHLRAEAQEAEAMLTGLEQQLKVELLEIEHERLQLGQQLREATANLNAAEAEREAARLRAQNAKRSHELRSELFKEGGAISGEAVRESENDRRTSEALMQASEAERVAASSARNKASLLGDALEIREQRIGIIEADIDRAKAILAQAEADLEGTAIRAPEDGAIVRRIVQAGGSVDVGQPIISMWLGNQVWVEAWIDEEDIADVRPGNKATVTLHSFPDREFIGTVDKLGLTTDFEMPDEDVPQPRFSRMRGTPVVGVRIQLDEPPAELLPGLSAVVSIRRSGS